MNATRLENLAHRLSNGLFGERATVDEAMAYAIELARASNDFGAVLTAVQVMNNTIAKEIRKSVDKQD